MACTEVRGAIFNTKCSPKERSKLKLGKSSKAGKEKLLANDFCIKDLAIEHLKEK